jgi:hypothetical protein
MIRIAFARDDARQQAAVQGRATQKHSCHNGSWHKSLAKMRKTRCLHNQEPLLQSD